MTAQLSNPSSTSPGLMQQICDELGLNRPAVVVNSTDIQIRQLFGLLRRATQELQQNYNWTALQTEYDLHVAQPIQATGSVILGSNVLTNVTAGTGDFGSDFGSDFATALTPSSAWVVNGQFIPVATRVTTVLGPGAIQISQPATATQDLVPLTFSRDTYPEPVDFDRFINQTWWDRTNRWSLLGPDSPQVDQWHRSGIVTIGPRRHFRQIGSLGTVVDAGGDFAISGPVTNYRLWPPPGAADTPIDIAFEYISKNIVVSAAGVYQPSWQADTDFPIIDGNAIILDTIWRWLKRKGMDYSQEQADARDYADRNYGNDGGAKILSMSSRRANFLLTTAQVQDGNFPSMPGVSGV